MAPPTIHVRVVRRHDAADGIICLDLAPVHGGRLPRFDAGAHVDVHVGHNMVRQYSLSNDPAEVHRYRLGILLESAGRGGSATIHRDFTEGAVVEISPPRNNFNLVEDAAFSVLIGGGIGITPLLSMAHRLSVTNRPFYFLYLARSRGRAAFLDEVDAFGSRAQVFFDDASVTKRFQATRDLPAHAASGHLYVCGPQGFMEAMIAAAGTRGWPEAAIHLEYFAAAKPIGAVGRPFTIEAKRSGRLVDVRGDRSAADALLAAGIDVPLSCETGVCGTCLTRVLEGVPEHRDQILTDAEKASNREMALCCSRAKSERLVLDI